MAAGPTGRLTAVRADRATRGGRTRTAARLAGALAIVVVGLGVAPRPVAALALVPVAIDDTGTVVHGRTRTVAAPGVLGNDLQLGTGFTVDLVSGPSHGDLSLSSNGGYTFQADDDYTGSDQFRYRVDGGLLGLSNIATVRITITNRRPDVAADAYDAIADVEIDIPAPGLLRNDDDPDGDALTVDIVDEPDGNLNERDDGSFRFKADADFEGTDTFTYRVWDGVAWSAPATVTITVGAPPPTPTPAPTTAPTPVATVAPTPAPTAAPTAPPAASATPRPRPTGTGAPTTASPSPSPATGPGAAASPTAGTTARPALGATPVPSASGGSSATPQQSDPPDGAAAGPLAGPPSSSPRPGADGPGAPLEAPFVVTAATDPGTVELDAAQVVFGGFEWTVPAVILTVPGLLLLLGVLTQAVVAVLFVPITRRSMDADRRRRRRRAA